MAVLLYGRDVLSRVILAYLLYLHDKGVINVRVDFERKISIMAEWSHCSCVVNILVTEPQRCGDSVVVRKGICRPRMEACVCLGLLKLETLARPCRGIVSLWMVCRCRQCKHIYQWGSWAAIPCNKFLLMGELHVVKHYTNTANKSLHSASSKSMCTVEIESAFLFFIISWVFFNIKAEIRETYIFLVSWNSE